MTFELIIFSKRSLNSCLKSSVHTVSEENKRRKELGLPPLAGKNPTKPKELVSVTPLSSGGGGGVKIDMSPVAREVSTLKDELSNLRRDMKKYLDSDGTNSRSVNRGFNRITSRL